MRITAITLALLLAFASVPCVWARDFTELFASVSPVQLVAVDDEGKATLNNICTATSINSDKHFWLSAAHCFELDSFGPRYIGGDVVKLIKIDPLNDIAIVQTERAFAPAMRMAKVAPELGDSLMVVGHPFGINLAILTFGSLAHPGTNLGDPQGKDYMLYTVVAAPGNSGSAVLNLKGEVISVLQIGFGRTFAPMVGGSTFEQLRSVTLGYWQME